MRVARSRARWLGTAALLLQLAARAPAAAQEPALDESYVSTEASELDAATQAQLDAILATGASVDDFANDQPSLSFYGFMDMTVQRSFVAQELRAIFPNHAIFAMGNINLYASANLTRGFSSLLEVRFSYMPNGTIDSKTLAYTNTTAQDHADWLRPNQWGGVVIERAHLDYSYHALLNVRMGQFLTPYGIWNVDHGSPTVIPITRPYPIGEQLFPTRQVGFEVFGSDLIGSVTLGYHLTLSNGRGPAYQLDFDRNKAVGGRVFVAGHGVGDLTVGLSAYGGRATLAPRIALDTGKIAVGSDDSSTEVALAADLLWEWRGLRIQGEFIANRVEYGERSRKLVSGYAGVNAGFVPDHLARGAYGLVGYRLPWAGLMPYFLTHYFDRGFAERQTLLTGANQVNTLGYQGGINVRPLAAVVFKVQGGIAWVPRVQNATQKYLSLQAAWAF